MRPSPGLTSGHFDFISPAHALDWLLCCAIATGTESSTAAATTMRVFIIGLFSSTKGHVDIASPSNSITPMLAERPYARLIDPLRTQGRRLKPAKSPLLALAIPRDQGRRSGSPAKYAST